MRGRGSCEYPFSRLREKVARRPDEGRAAVEMPKRETVVAKLKSPHPAFGHLLPQAGEGSTFPPADPSSALRAPSPARGEGATPVEPLHVMRPLARLAAATSRPPGRAAHGSRPRSARPPARCSRMMSANSACAAASSAVVGSSISQIGRRRDIQPAPARRAASGRRKARAPENRRHAPAPAAPAPATRTHGGNRPRVCQPRTRGSRLP